MDAKYSTIREELSAIGIQSAIRLLSVHRKCSESDVIEYLSHKLGRAIPHIASYKVHGIPPHAAPDLLKIMRENRIPFSMHQLVPTKKVVAMHEWRNSKR